MPPEQDRANIIAPPPLIFLATLLVGLALGWRWPTPALAPLGGYLLGGGLALLAVLLAGTCIRCFLKAGTTADPYTLTSTIVRHGPYRFSRNPMYLSLCLLQTGIGVALGNLWLPAMLPLALLIVRYGVVAREEAYLARKFGEEYLAYTRQVRRWI